MTLLGNKVVADEINEIEVILKQSRPLWSLLPMSSACLLSVEKLQPKNKFNQRNEKMQKQIKAVKQDKTRLV